MLEEPPTETAARSFIRWGRILAVVVIAGAALNWIGWATGVEILTRIRPDWPPMTPWTALWLAALAGAILLRSGFPPPGRCRAGVGVAAAVGALAAVVLLEYLTAQSFGLDRWWFPESVADLPSAWPGRPSPQTAFATLTLAAAIGLPQMDRRWIHTARAAFLLTSSIVAGLAVVAYLFQATAFVETEKSTGISLPTALSLFALGAATLTLRPIVSILAPTGRWRLGRLGVLVIGFPLVLGSSLRALRAVGLPDSAGVAGATTLATVAIGAVTFQLGKREERLLEQLKRQNELIASSERNFRLLIENAGDVVCHVRDGLIVWVSPSVQTVLGVPASSWLGHPLADALLAADMQAGADLADRIIDGDPITQRLRIVGVDGADHWIELRAKPFSDDRGRRDGVGVTLRPIDDQVAAEQATEAARRQQARADERYRRSMDSAAIGMCLIAPDGRFEDVNPALCNLFGYSAEALTQKTWQELTAPNFLAADQSNVDAILEGRLDSYRMIKQYIHSDGHPIWGDLSVSCIRDADGRVESFLSQITDITEAVQAAEQNQILAQRLKLQTDRMRTELHSAAEYMTSILPSGLTGEVGVASRYLPSQELGGDCFDYTWIDDEHLLVYLVDVSGHGIEPALLSVSVHNMLRSGSLSADTLKDPAAVLAKLNHLFQMDRHGDHYFTMWCGVYHTSSNTLRYASAGATPALAFTPGTTAAADVTELFTESPPVGMFDDTVFTTNVYPVPPGCRVLLFSDGASEIELAEGRQLTLDEFQEIALDLAGRPNWSLDDLISELRSRSRSETFEDDCSLIQLTFNNLAHSAPPRRDRPAHDSV